VIEDVLARVDQLKGETASDDPLVIAKHLKIETVPMEGSIKGYAMHISVIELIGYNVNLNAIWQSFSTWHELTHVFDKHIYEPGVSFLCDGSFCEESVYSNNIPRHERIANFAAAHAVLNDDDVMEATGFSIPAYREYRKLSAEYTKFCRRYEDLRDVIRFSRPSRSMLTQLNNLRRSIHSTSEELKELEDELVNCYGPRTLEDAACDLGTEIRILEYKLEGMRLRGLDIDPHELEQYNKMFEGVFAADNM